MQIWDCNGSAAQLWNGLPTNSGGAGAFTDAIKSVINMGVCLDVAGANTADGTPIQVANCNGNLVWSDEFNGTSLDTSSWNYEVNCDAGGNNEDECYTSSPSNVSAANGVLSIGVMKQGGLANGKTYTSGRINTSGKGMWTYGRFETSLKVPCGQGFWPAAWMMPQDSVYGTWPTSGELDIMEILGGNPSVLYGTAHFGQPWPNQEQLGGTYTLSGDNFCGAFHQFALEWYPDHATWFVDGNAYFTLTSTSANWAPAPNLPFNERFYFILNVAMGGNWPRAPDPTIQSGAMEVDYVRVYAQQ